MSDALPVYSYGSMGVCALLPESSVFFLCGPGDMSGAPATPPNTYYHRALADPGPGYVRWRHTAIDPTGVHAGSAVQADTVVVTGIKIGS